MEKREKLTFGSLFAGIGGFDLGFERAGMECKWQVENDEYCKQVLERLWPNVKRWSDVRTFDPRGTEWGCDVICGGFPCQDISNAGTREGLDGARSGLWFEFARIIRLLRPSYVVVENVAALLELGVGRILGDLAGIGFDATWEVLSACRLRCLTYTTAIVHCGLRQRPRWTAAGSESHYTAGPDATSRRRFAACKS